MFQQLLTNWLNASATASGEHRYRPIGPVPSECPGELHKPALQVTGWRKLASAV
jgi:hypothetical protein